MISLCINCPSLIFSFYAQYIETKREKDAKVVEEQRLRDSARLRRKKRARPNGDASGMIDSVEDVQTLK